MIAIRKSQVFVLGRLSYRIIAVWDLDTLGSSDSMTSCRNLRAWGACILPTQFLEDQVTLYQGGQIMPTKLLPAPRIFKPSYGHAMACFEAHSKSH